MRKFTTRILGVLALLVFAYLAGCINYDQDVQINENGSGKLIMHYSLPQQLTAMMAMGDQSTEKKEDNQMPFKITEDEVKKDLAAKGVKVEKFETKTEGDKNHYYVTIAFDNITDLNQTKTFAKMPFQWKKEGSVYTFSQTLMGEKKKEGENADDAMGKQMAQAMLGNAKFTYKITLPSKALPAPDTNGKIAEDGKTISWEYPLTELSGGGDKVMTAKFKSGGLPIMLIAGIGAAALLSLIAFAVVIMIARKKS
jgi:hypothetical protein